MIQSIAADALLVLHALFVLFVVLGSALVLRWPKMAYLHVPCVLWGAGIEFAGAICPLTPWEQRLRLAAGEAGYSGGFIEHYLLPLIYPPGLTYTVQLVLGGAVLAINLAAYGYLFHRARRSARRTSP